MCLNNNARFCEGVNVEALSEVKHKRLRFCNAAERQMYQHLARHKVTSITCDNVEIPELLKSINCWFPNSKYPAVVTRRVQAKLKALFAQLIKAEVIVSYQAPNGGMECEWPGWTRNWLLPTWDGDISPPPETARADTDPTGKTTSKPVDATLPPANLTPSSSLNPSWTAKTATHRHSAHSSSSPPSSFNPSWTAMPHRSLSLQPLVSSIDPSWTVRHPRPPAASAEHPPKHIRGLANSRWAGDVPGSSDSARQSSQLSSARLASGRANRTWVQPAVASEKLQQSHPPAVAADHGSARSDRDITAGGSGVFNHQQRHVASPNDDRTEGTTVSFQPTLTSDANRTCESMTSYQPSLVLDVNDGINYLNAKVDSLSIHPDDSVSCCGTAVRTTQKPRSPILGERNDERGNQMLTPPTTPKFTRSSETTSRQDDESTTRINNRPCSAAVAVPFPTSIPTVGNRDSSGHLLDSVLEWSAKAAQLKLKVESQRFEKTKRGLDSALAVAREARDAKPALDPATQNAFLVMRLRENLDLASDKSSHWTEIKQMQEDSARHTSFAASRIAEMGQGPGAVAGAGAPFDDNEGDVGGRSVERSASRRIDHLQPDVAFDANKELDKLLEDHF